MKKRAKNWTRNVIYMPPFIVCHPADRYRNKGVKTIPFFCTRVIWYYFFNWNNISRGIRAFVNNSWFGYAYALDNLELIWFWSVRIRKTAKRIFCSCSPADHDCGQLFLRLVVLRKLSAENWLDKLYRTDIEVGGMQLSGENCELLRMIIYPRYIMWRVYIHVNSGENYE